MIYHAAVALRNMLYDRGLLESSRLPVPVISVGNITAGGAGKTPLAGRLVQHALDYGNRAVYVTRGYRRDSRGTVLVSDGAGAIVDARVGGDEPVMIARMFPGIPVIADERRARGGMEALRLFTPDLLILDDAFQHRSCARDLDIVAIDASSNPFVDRLLPFGRLREPLASLRRAHVLVLTRWRETEASLVLESRLRADFDAPIDRATFTMDGLHDATDGRQCEPTSIRGEIVVSFCGLAVPAAFLGTLEELSLESVSHVSFPDHHRFTDAELVERAEKARTLARPRIVTTAKDAVRFSDRMEIFHGVEVLVIDMRVSLARDGVLLRRMDALLAHRESAS